MAVQFGPLGSSQILGVSGTSARVAFGSVPTVSPAIAIVSLSPLLNALYVTLGGGAVTASLTTSNRCDPGSSENPLILPISAGETNVAIITEGPVGDVVVTPGQYVAGLFTPVGASQIIAVTNTDQRFALPTLGAVAPAFSLVSMQGLMEAVWIKTGNVAVVGSVTTSMKVMPGSSDEPAVIRVTAGETHLSIFCDGTPGDIILTPGNVVADPATAAGQFVAKAGDTMTGLLTVQRDLSGDVSSFQALSADSGAVFGPQFKASRASASPAAGDMIGRYAFQGKDSNGNDTIYAYLQGRIDNPTDGAEASSLLAGYLVGGVEVFGPIVAPTSPAQGDVSYYNGTNWVRLPAGTSGNFLQTLGAGANPQWASPGTGLTLLNSGTVSAAATLDIVLTSFTAFRGLKLLLSGFRPATNNVDLWLRVSTNGGSTYLTATYDSNVVNFDSISVPLNGPTNNTAQINITNAGSGTDKVGNATTQGVNAIIDILNQTSNAFFSRISAEADFVSGTVGRATHCIAGGQQSTAQDTDAIRIMFSGGSNITAGNWALYGYN